MLRTTITISKIRQTILLVDISSFNKDINANTLNVLTTFAIKNHTIMVRSAGPVGFKSLNNVDIHIFFRLISIFNEVVPSMAGDMPIDNETPDVTQIQSPQLSSLEVILKIECLYVYRSGYVYV